MKISPSILLKVSVCGVIITLAACSSPSKAPSAVQEFPSSETEDLSEAEELATEKSAPPLCLENDQIDWWEKVYCRLKTEMENPLSVKVRSCLAELKKDKSYPQDRCPKILWLKTKTCDLWSFPAFKEQVDCHQDEEFSSKVDANPSLFFGN